jgi:hypothetical protein
MAAARPWLKLAAGVVAGIGVLGLAFYLYVRSAERRGWEEMRRYCEQKAWEARARDPRRPVLRGVAVEGNAWDDYNQALASLAGASADLKAAHDLIYSTKGDPAKVRAIVKVHAPAIQALRRGVSRSSARRHVDWESAPDSLDTTPIRFAYLPVCKARFLLEDGSPREAMELLLDTARYGEDVALNGTHLDGLLGISILNTLQDELNRFLSSGALGPENLRRLETELEILDRAFPSAADAYGLEPMPGGFEYLRKPSIQEHLRPLGITNFQEPPVASWRYGFSERLVLVDAFQSGIQWAGRMKEAADKPWKEAREIQDRARARMADPKNPLIRELFRIQESLSSSPAHDSFRDCRARLRLLRAAARFRATGELLALDDPYGDKIRSSITETRLKLWSVGADGVDDGGTGGWDSRGKDIVLEVDR